MPDYDSENFDPPAPVAYVTLRNPATGVSLPDVPMLIAGMDPCFSCNDRMVTVARPDGRQNMSWEQLRQHGIEYYKR